MFLVFHQKQKLTLQGTLHRSCDPYLLYSKNYLELIDQGWVPLNDQNEFALFHLYL